MCLYNKSPFFLLVQAVISNRPVIIFVRNNRKLVGYIRAFDKHVNLILENVRELWTTCVEKNIFYHERYIAKMILRGDSIVLLLCI
ncbi:small nuclear ribonucleoprotein SM D2 (nucleomorph) [Cryptomonas paramecium]|uniref:Small nuclear ribonucleoprotein Sm D2 n=1 Tax=Cryptomonas paramaecium TaxID=2898 RepID=F2HHF7_9CRYP|nr:small nuclear ribonucleoprotein SM D2 [Cryptomonas paramecium]AEA38753.1 small nuclear ribonucleoprotein SM D2 [Cryptomonas paramecium]|mmetsp:Transcript_74473/g.199069  ORF Transcript_74473/g.199069 Transcript_74473/m.199069 type:complete len:86 (+) Transcript_74473:2758-3015(+)